MTDIDTKIKSLILPDQLKEYFKNSRIIHDFITDSILNNIEDLYIFYQSLYTFDTSEFSAFTITSLKKCKDYDSFYYYLKKVIDTNLVLTTKDNNFKDKNLHINNNMENEVFRNSVRDFCILIDGVYHRKENISIAKTYMSLGKLELITDITNNLDYERILKAGINVLNKYEETKK